MTNAQLYTLLTPALVSLFGVFFAAWRTDKHLDDLRADMNRQFTDVNRRFADMDRQFDKINATLQLIQGDLTRFHGIQSAHDEAISNIKQRLD